MSDGDGSSEGSGGGTGDAGGGSDPGGSGGGDPDSGPGGPEGGNGPGSGPAGGPAAGDTSSTPGESFADALAAGYTAPEAPPGGITGAINGLLDWAFGPAKTTQERVANAFVDLVTAAIPGAGLAKAFTDFARAQGWDVEDASLPDQEGGSVAPGAARTGIATGSPYSFSEMTPERSPPVPGQPDPDFPFLPVGQAGPFMLATPYARPADSLGASEAIGVAGGPQTGGTPSSDSENGLLGPLAAAAVIAGVVAFG